MTPITEIRSGDFVEFQGHPYHVGIRRVVNGEVQLGLNRLAGYGGSGTTTFIRPPAKVKILAKWPRFPKDYRR